MVEFLAGNAQSSASEPGDLKGPLSDRCFFVTSSQGRAAPNARANGISFHRRSRCSRASAANPPTELRTALLVSRAVQGNLHKKPPEIINRLAYELAAFCRASPDAPFRGDLGLHLRMPKLDQDRELAKTSASVTRRSQPRGKYSHVQANQRRAGGSCIRLDPRRARTSQRPRQPRRNQAVVATGLAFRPPVP